MQLSHPHYSRTHHSERAGLRPAHGQKALRRARDCAAGLIVMLLLSRHAGAQLAPADSFFNTGAQFYISNNIPSALEQVENGLKTHPNDEKLKKLEELLKQQQQQQSQSQQSQQQQQNKQNQQSQSNQQQQKNQQQQQQNQQPENQEQQNQSNQKNAEQQKQQQQPQQKSSAEKQNEQKQENQPEQGQPMTAGQMTPEEAKRLLDAQKGDEQVLQWKPQGRPEDQNRPVKDW
jgi:hypothetical protein